MQLTDPVSDLLQAAFERADPQSLTAATYIASSRRYFGKGRLGGVGKYQVGVDHGIFGVEAGGRVVAAAGD